MKMPSRADTEELLERARDGDAAAGEELLDRHRDRLRRMVAVRLDRRVAARVDPSDVVQEALAEAARGLPDFLDQRPLPFYAWLRQFAWQRLVKLHRHHIGARKRSVTREVPRLIPLPDESVSRLASLLDDRATSPSQEAIRAELLERLHAALDRLSPTDREILVMRNLEQLHVAEIAAVLEIAENAAKVRHLRALRRLRALLGDIQ